MGLHYDEKDLLLIYRISVDTWTAKKLVLLKKYLCKLAHTISFSIKYQYIGIIMVRIVN